MPVSTVACAIAGDVDGAHRCTPSVTQRGRSLGQGGESVDIRAASKNYDAVRALDNVTLNVAPREFVSLLGPSGSGKTTLLGILGGFIQPSSGSIHFGDRDVTFLPPHKRDIGVVFQNYALFPHMSVGENVAFPLRARRIPKADWAARVRAALGMVGLSGYETRGIAQLSGGQRQRVALDLRTAPDPDGRAAVGARQAVARSNADRTARAAQADRRHDHLRHPRPARGADDERPRCDPERRAAGPDRSPGAAA